MSLKAAVLPVLLAQLMQPTMLNSSAEARGFQFTSDKAINRRYRNTMNFNDQQNPEMETQI
jgi:hypothetical protein